MTTPYICGACNEGFVFYPHLLSHVHQRVSCSLYYKNQPLPSNLYENEGEELLNDEPILPSLHSTRMDVDTMWDVSSGNESESDTTISDTSNHNIGEEFEEESKVSFAHISESYNSSLILPLRIMNLLQEAGCTPKVYDSLRKILIEEDHRAGGLSVVTIPSYKSLLNKLKEAFPNVPKPISMTVKFERTQKQVDVNAPSKHPTFPVYDFLTSLKDLLSSKHFHDLDNLVVNKDDPWAPYTQPSNCINEIQDGEWYQSIVRTNKYSGKDDFIIGLDTYIDKTAAKSDVFQRTSIEPFMFTLTIFKKRIRNNPMNWRPFGMLPKFPHQLTNDFGQNQRNYHVVLKGMLKSLIHLQNNPPWIKLRLGDTSRLVRARIVWVKTTADGLANEYLIGRVQNRQETLRLCRACHTPHFEASNCIQICKYLKQRAIEQLIVSGLGPSSNETFTSWNTYQKSLPPSDIEKSNKWLLRRKKIVQEILKRVFNQHLCDLVWFEIDMGPNDRGCFGMTPVDPMHAFEHGIITDFLSIVLEPLSLSQKARLDLIAQSLLGNGRSSEREDYPRISFQHGFTKLTLLSAEEQVGKLLLLLIIGHTNAGRQILEQRCSTNFDTEKKRKRLTKEKNISSLSNSQQESQSKTQLYDRNNPTHLEFVKKQLGLYGLKYIIPWLDNMEDYHVWAICRIVFSLVKPIIKNDNIHTNVVFEVQDPTIADRRNFLYSDQWLNNYGKTPINNDIYSEERKIDALSNISTFNNLVRQEASYSIDGTVDDLLSIMECLLTFHAYYKYGSTDKAEIVTFREKISKMLQLLKATLERPHMGWNISKFHDLLHLPEDCHNFGCASNFDAGVGESGLKKWAKHPSKIIQTRGHSKYIHDIARVSYNQHLVETGMSALKCNILPFDSGKKTSTVLGLSVTMETESDDVTKGKISFKKPHILIQSGGKAVSTDSNGRVLMEKVHELPKDLISFIWSQQDEKVNNIQLFSEAYYHDADDSIRATPNYRKTGPWFDWVEVKFWEKRNDSSKVYKYYPFKILAFWIGKDKNRNDIPYLTGRCCDVPKYRKGNIPKQSTIIKHWELLTNKYYTVPANTVGKKIIAIQVTKACSSNIGIGKELSKPNALTTHVLTLTERIGEWPKAFLMEDHLKQKDTLLSFLKKKKKQPKEKSKIKKRKTNY